ncbi:MAG: hypothetical protein V4708_18650 [Bacteroidota bacterium]
MVKLIMLLNMAIFMMSCSKNDPKLLLGQYSGSYYYRGLNMSSPEKSVHVVNLKLNPGNSYESSGFPDRKPAGGSGEYKIADNRTVEFSDKNFWTAEFDWKLILNGRFTYEIKADSLILTRYQEPCVNCNTYPQLYQYRLKRVD